MKNFILLILTVMISLGAHSQSVTIVSDPSSIVQRLTLASEEMEEQIEQKYKFIEQIRIAQKAYEESKKMQERVEVVSEYIKTAGEVIDIIELGEEILNTIKSMKKSLSDSRIINEEEKQKCIEDIVKFSSRISDIAKRASAIVHNKTNNNDVQLNDYERQQELRYLKKNMEQIKEKILETYNSVFTYNLAKNRNESLFNFINF
ncbi:MAG: hypothetical protein IK017_07210 [Paludibacteraceae bacterium]|nr:hypothetical protein [Paludibacteraceae bacterium]MBR5972423.1 hypothetical protein [Paludibacteraceae bacterium]